MRARYEEPPELTPEDEAAIDRALDEKARLRGHLPSVPSLTDDEARTYWAEFLSGARRAPTALYTRVLGKRLGAPDVEVQRISAASIRPEVK